MPITDESNPIPTPKSSKICDESPINQCCRQSAKGVLDDKIYRLKTKIYELENFRAMLPTQLTKEQDAALWSFLVETR